VNPIDEITQLNIPNFRKEQIFHAVFKESKLDFDLMTNLPLSLRGELKDKIHFRTLKLLKEQVSEKKDTVKWSFLTEKGKPIETVLMIHANGRRTLCVSCQSGCPVNCSFCWTGAMGFQQNLSAYEIIEQILVANEWLRHKTSDIRLQTSITKDSNNIFAETEGSEVSNLKSEDNSVNRIVFMGMGEPMINLIEVTKSIKTILDPKFFGLSQRAVTVSTSGYIPMMKKFWSEFPKIGLAISLHAPNQELRAQIMPVAKQFSLNDLIQTCKEIQAQTKRRATYEYILIDNLTDTEECAVQLAELLKGQLAHVNAIPYNPIEGREFKRPSRNRVMNFCNKLRQLGVSVTPRITMGDDIKAACGQLSKHEAINN
jgi:23S rRNA (adenine2503-C2)-methyltransferase